MNRFRNPLFLVLLILLALVALGCSRAKGTETESALAPESAPAPAPADTADLAIQSVMKGLSENRPQVLWQALPASYQEDLTALVHESAAKMDEELWNRSFGVVRKLGRLLGEKRSFLLDNPMFASQMKDRDETEASWDAAVGLLDVVTNSELADLERLKTVDIEKFLAGTGARLMKQMTDASALTPNDSYAAKMGDLAATKVTVLSSEGDAARVRIETPGTPPREQDYLRVEGKWISKQLADEWPTTMAEAREKLAGFSGEQNQEEKQAVMMQLAMFEAALDQLLAANTVEQFNAGIGATMGMAMGAIMSQAAEASIAQGDSSVGPGGSPFPMPTTPIRPGGRQGADLDHALAYAMQRAVEGGAKKPFVSDNGTIPLGDLDSFVGQYVRVKGKGGLDTSGRLENVRGDVFDITQQFGGGTMSVEVSKREVQKVQLVR